MSGHTPTILTMTSVAGHSSRELLNTLEQAFLARLRREISAPGRDTASEWASHHGGRLVIGDNDISAEIEFLHDPSRAGNVCPVLLLHSGAYEAAFDLVGVRERPAGKRALIDFCVAAAGAAGAEGFSLEFAGDRPLEPLTIESLVASLTSVTGGGLLRGVATSSPMLASVKAFWPHAAELNGYLVVDFI